MFFTKKNKTADSAIRDPYVNEVKQALAEPEYEEVYKEPPGREKKEFAPLFVKVDKYHDMLLIVQDMKTFVSGIKQLFVVLQELETVRGESLNLLRTTVQRLEKNLAELDTDLLRPKGVEMDLHQDEVEVGHIEKSLNDLQSQLGALRKELQEFK